MGKQHAPFETTGQAGKADRSVQAESRQHRLHPVSQVPAIQGFQPRLRLAQRSHVIATGVQQLLVTAQRTPSFAQALGNDVVDAAGGALGHLLRQLRHAQARLADQFPFVGLLFAGNDSQQGGLALAIAAQQTDAFARIDGQLHRVQQRGHANMQGESLELEQHGGLGISLSTGLAAGVEIGRAFRLASEALVTPPVLVWA